MLLWLWPGVMAVSMLAGCGTDKKPTTDGEGEGETVVAGYSTTFADKLGKAVTDLDYVSFKDNAADAAALQKSQNNISEATPAHSVHLTGLLFRLKIRSSLTS